MNVRTHVQPKPVRRSLHRSIIFSYTLALFGQLTHTRPTQNLWEHNCQFAFRLTLCLVAGLVFLGLWPTHTYAQGVLDQVGWVSPETKNTRSVAWGDMDGDGDLDLAVGNFEQVNQLYVNNGQGNFTARNLGIDKRKTNSVAWGDMDGDGDLDLAVGNLGEVNQLYINHGQGNFEVDNVKLGIEEKNHTRSVAWGDMDGDGDLDLAVGNSGSNELNQLYENNGRGTFTLTAPFTDPMRTWSVAWGDMDGDGDLDLAVGNGGDGNGNNLVNQLYINHGQGNFEVDNVKLGIEEKRFSQSVAWGDMDGDGDLDLVVGNGGNGKGNPPVNQLYENDGHGTFTLTVPFTDTTRTRSVAWGDMDGDGDLDLAVGNSGVNQLYENDGHGNFATPPVNLGTSISTWSMAWGDMDGDGDLDLAVGNDGQENQIYVNTGQDNFAPPVELGTEADWSLNMAWGDMDGDGDLDLVGGNNSQENQLYVNDGTGSFTPEVPLTGTGTIRRVALGDMDSDGDLDLAVGNFGQVNQVYLNDGRGQLITPTLDLRDVVTTTRSMAWGDVDGDGDLDLAVGNDGQNNQIYVNDGRGTFTVTVAFTGTKNTWSVAWGDMDSDGDLDLAVGNFRDSRANPQANQLYVNDGQGNFTVKELGPELRRTLSVAWGDVDGDGDLDLAVGNSGQLNQLYVNDGQGNFTAKTLGTEIQITTSVAWGDVDGDGDLDLAVGNFGLNQLYINDGQGNFAAKTLGTDIRKTYSVAWGDMDRDGDLDLAVGNSEGGNRLYVNEGQGGLAPANNLSTITPAHPYTSIANFYGQPRILTKQNIPLTYTLFDPEGDSVGSIGAEYSLNGGGQWFPAKATPGTVTTHLATGAYPTATITNTHVYTWNTFASGFFGQSDNVVFRLVAYPHPKQSDSTGAYNYTNSAPGPIQRPYASATTFPFRVRGTQVQVLDESGKPVEGALVYRLQDSHFAGAQPISDGKGVPYRTDAQGFLQGRGTLAEGDQLVALLPVTSTHTFVASDMLDPLPESLPFVLYHTSAKPTESGLAMQEVERGGVQTLIISADNPLLLFNLDLSLEWDARNDGLFMQELDNALKRASEVLYDATNGQAALGEITVHQAKEKWMGADIVLYARNDMRPRANTGGVVITETQDIFLTSVGITETKPNAYLPGHIRMGPNWDPFGQSQAELTQDWWRTLTHELAHYLFFLPDNYLGVKENSIAQIDCKGSFMTNAYDAGYGEFLHPEQWHEEPVCLQSVAHTTTGRSDWETISKFYPDLVAPSNFFAGPTSLPLAVTKLVTSTESSIDAATTLPMRNFDLRNASGEITSFSQARAYLYKTRKTVDPQDDAVIALGSTGLSSDRIKVRGAEAGDRLCVLANSEGKAQTGCIELRATSTAIQLNPISGWQPDIVVSARTTRTLFISVTQEVDPGGKLFVQLFPAYGSPISSIQDVIAPVAELVQVGSSNVYTQQMSLEEPAFEGFVRVWASDARTTVNTKLGEPAKEAVSQFFLSTGWGGNGPGFSCAGNLRPWFASHRAAEAPIASGDGRVTLFNVENVIEGPGVASLQALATIPGLKPWQTQVGLAYRLVSKEHITATREIAFQYLQRDVPVGFEETLRIYYSADEGETWRALSTNGPDVVGNLINIQMPVPADGIYSLIAAVDIPLTRSGLNLFGYPIPQTQPITQALQSLEGEYSFVMGQNVTEPDGSWLIHIPDAPESVNSLKTLEYGQGYFIQTTKPITLQLDVTPAAPATFSPTNEPAPSSIYFGEPPAIYFGLLPLSFSLYPEAQIALTATIDGVICGQGQVIVDTPDEAPFFIVQVAAERAETVGCGRPGSEIQFYLDGVLLPNTASWDNTQAHRIDMHGLPD
ncbi:MAG: VCBS repeat-containing protein [Chloroflexota bacterium]